MRPRVVQFYLRWPFWTVFLGEQLTLCVLFKGGWSWRGFDGWRLYDRVGSSRVFRFGPLVVNYLPRRKGVKR
jgi:hypothetical protein